MSRSGALVPLSRVAIVLPAAIGAAFAFASTRLGVGDTDVFWHLVAGRETLAHGLARVDTYSWTVRGDPISTDQWLGQVLFALASNLAGWRGIVGLRALAVALLIGLVVYATLRARKRPLVAVIAALPAIVLSAGLWTERPQLLGYVCFSALIVLLRAARGGSDRALLALPFLMVLWANVHGSFALGAVLIALVAAEGAFRDPRRRRTYLAALALSAFATIATPSGIGSWTAPSYHLLHPPRELQEWSVPDVTALPGAIFAVSLFATLAVAFFAREPAPGEAILLLPVLFVALTAVRQMPLFAIATAPYLARHGGEAVGQIASLVGLHVPTLAQAGKRPNRLVDAIAVAIATVVLAVGVATGTDRPSLDGFPTEALPLLRPGPGLFNQYDWGGYLIANAPATPVFVDGRFTPYVADVIGDYTTVVGVHPGWREVIARRGITQLLVRPTDPVAVRARDLGWPIRASSDTFVLIDVP